MIMRIIGRNYLASIAFLGSLAAGSAALAADPTAGAVNADGSIQEGSKSYTVSHPGPGHYIITFATAYSPVVICNFQSIFSPLEVLELHVTATTCDVTFATTGKKHKATDTLFTFIAVQIAS